MLPKGCSSLYAEFSKMSSTFSKNIKKIFYGAQFLRNLLIKTGSFQQKILFKKYYLGKLILCETGQCH